MSRRRLSVLLTPVLLLAATLFGCDPRAQAPDVLPTSPEHGPLAALSVSEAEYTLVEDPLLPGLSAEDLTTSELIGATGGQLSLLGHTLTVPAGAVRAPTLFTITVLASGYVEVDLSAAVGLLDVGSKGFAKPVPVSLTYSRATNLKKHDKPFVARIHSVDDYSDLEPLESTIDAETQTVTAYLDHFSRYCLATP